MVRKKVGLTIKYIILGIALVWIIFPIFWIVSISFKIPGDIFHWPPVWIPDSITVDHYVRAFKLGGFAIKNSLIIAGCSTIGVIAVSSLAAYSISRWETGGTQFTFGLLTLRMLPPVALVFPVYLVFVKLGWVDTFRAITIMHMTFNIPFGVWILKRFFADVPREVEENAQIDGCSELGVLLKITLPLTAPGLIVTAIFCFIFSWQEYAFALILTRKEVTPISVFLTRSFGGEAVLWGEIGALSTISMIPMFVLGIAIRKYLIRGLTLGAIK